MDAGTNLQGLWQLDQDLYWFKPDWVPALRRGTDQDLYGFKPDGVPALRGELDMISHLYPRSCICLATTYKEKVSFFQRSFPGYINHTAD